MKNQRTFFICGFAALMFFDTFAQVCFKFTALHAAPLTFDLPWLMRVFATPWVYCSILGYFATFVLWMTLLRRVAVGPAFAASHLEIVGVLLISMPLFGEYLSLLQCLGAVLILGGVFFLAYDETDTIPEGIH